MLSPKDLADYHFQQVTLGLGTQEVRAQEIQKACDGLEPSARRAFIRAYNATLTGEEPKAPTSPRTMIGKLGESMASRHFDEMTAAMPEQSGELREQQTSEVEQANSALSIEERVEFAQGMIDVMEERAEALNVAGGIMPVPVGDLFMKARMMGLAHWEESLPVLFSGGDTTAIDAKNAAAKEETAGQLDLEEAADFLGGYSAGAKLAMARHQAQPEMARAPSPVPQAPPAPVTAPSIVEAVPFWSTNSGKVEFIAGDYGTGRGSIQNSNAIQLPARKGAIAFRHIKSVSIANEESVKKLGGTLGWGAVGAVALGPVGLLAGLLGGGNKTDVTFIVVFSDNTKLLARAETSVFTKLQGAAFQ